MKKRLTFVLATVALAAVATAAIGLTRPLQMAGGASAAPVWTPPTVTAGRLPLPPLAPPRSLVAAAVHRAPPRRSHVAVVPGPPPAMPPSTVLVSRPDSGIPMRPFTTTATPISRPSPNPVAAAAIPAPAANDVAAPAPAAAPSNPVAFAPDPADSNHLWVEKPGEREQPQIRVYNRSRLTGQLVIRANAAQRAWAWRRSGLVIDDAVEPIEYTYEVRGPIYRFTGRPDVAGTLRCRKYRIYEIELWERAPWEGWETMHRDLGD